MNFTTFTDLNKANKGIRVFIQKFHSIHSILEENCDSKFFLMSALIFEDIELYNETNQKCEFFEFIRVALKLTVNLFILNIQQNAEGLGSDHEHNMTNEKFN